MDKGSDRTRTKGWRYRDRPAHLRPYVASQLRPAPADQWDPDQLPEPMAGTQFEPDDAHLPGTCAGLDRKSGDGAMKIVNCNGKMPAAGTPPIVTIEPFPIENDLEESS